jgi:hypothetical protein
MVRRVLWTRSLLSNDVVALFILEELVHFDNVGMILYRRVQTYVFNRKICPFFLFAIIKIIGRKQTWGVLTNSLKMLISLKSIFFSSSSMWLFLKTLTAR